jgi:hypothetical protein
MACVVDVKEAADEAVETIDIDWIRERKRGKQETLNVEIDYFCYDGRENEQMG